MKRHAFIFLFGIAVSFVMASCGEDVELERNEMCILSGGKWIDPKCQCGDPENPCGDGIFCIGEKDNIENPLRCADQP